MISAASRLPRLRRLALAGALALAGTAVALSSATTASAATGPAPKATPGPLWAKACAKRPDGASLCYVEQFAIDPARDMVVLHVRLGYLGVDGKPRIAVTAPLGVSLPGGVNLTLDGDKPIGVPYQTCAAEGCLMIAVLEPDVLARLLKAKALTVTYLDAANAPVAVPMRLQGLAQAFTAVQKAP